MASRSPQEDYQMDYRPGLAELDTSRIPLTDKVGDRVSPYEKAALSAAGLNLENLERSAILCALEECEWIQSRAARSLGISPRALVYKIKKHAITHPRLEARRRRR
jgi:transcriptional regulator with GAF, ATPase, and Fis domain